MSKTKKAVTKNSPKPAKKQPAISSKTTNNSTRPEKPDRPNSKQDILITLMKRPSGATLEELVSATNWQKHSVRGTISGALKKRLKLPIISEQETRGRIYRIAGDQA